METNELCSHGENDGIPHDVSYVSKLGKAQVSTRTATLSGAVIQGNFVDAMFEVGGGRYEDGISACRQESACRETGNGSRQHQSNSKNEHNAPQQKSAQVAVDTRLFLGLKPTASPTDDGGGCSIVTLSVGHSDLDTPIEMKTSDAVAKANGTPSADQEQEPPDLAKTSLKVLGSTGENEKKGDGDVLTAALSKVTEVDPIVQISDGTSPIEPSGDAVNYEGSVNNDALSPAVEKKLKQSRLRKKKKDRDKRKKRLECSTQLELHVAKQEQLDGNGRAANQHAKLLDTLYQTERSLMADLIFVCRSLVEFHKTCLHAPTEWADVMRSASVEAAFLQLSLSKAYVSGMCLAAIPRLFLGTERPKESILEELRRYKGKLEFEDKEARLPPGTLGAWDFRGFEGWELLEFSPTVHNHMQKAWSFTASVRSWVRHSLELTILLNCGPREQPIIGFPTCSEEFKAMIAEITRFATQQLHPRFPRRQSVHKFIY